jgi:membrane associated rhomboid family serine protease
MFVPLHDDAPLQVIRFQFVTLSVIIGNIVIYLFTGAFQGEDLTMRVAASFGVIPHEFTDVSNYGVPDNPIPSAATFLTYMFVHGSWMHLLTNMLFLWVFADNVEDAFGHVSFAIFYLICGAVAAGAHVMMAPNSDAPLIGASGAVSGVLGAYLMLYPRARVLMLMLVPIPIRISAIWVLGIWFVIQIYSLYQASGNGAVEVAWWAHIGGFIAGMLLTLILRSRLLIRS